MLMSWWFWIAGAVVFAILETLAPVFIFLGLAGGAAVVGILLAIGVGFGGSLAWMLVGFATISLVITVLCRLAFGGQTDETQVFTDDINKG